MKDATDRLVASVGGTDWTTDTNELRIVDPSGGGQPKPSPPATTGSAIDTSISCPWPGKRVAQTVLTDPAVHGRHLAGAPLMARSYRPDRYTSHSVRSTSVPRRGLWDRTTVERLDTGMAHIAFLVISRYQDHHYKHTESVRQHLCAEVDRNPRPGPVPLNSSLLPEIEGLYPEEIARPPRARFRSPSDFAAFNMLAPYYVVASRGGVEWPDIPGEFVYVGDFLVAMYPFPSEFELYASDKTRPA